MTDKIVQLKRINSNVIDERDAIAELIKHVPEIKVLLQMGQSALADIDLEHISAIRLHWLRLLFTFMSDSVEAMKAEMKQANDDHD